MFPKLLEDLSKHNKLDLETILSCGLPCLKLDIDVPTFEKQIFDEAIQECSSWREQWGFKELFNDKENNTDNQTKEWNGQLLFGPHNWQEWKEIYTTQHCSDEDQMCMKYRNKIEFSWRLKTNNPIRKYVESLFPNILDINIVNFYVLPPGGYLFPHVDPCTGPKNLNKLYIPLLWETGNEFGFYKWGNMPLKQGNVYLINNYRFAHWVLNRSNTHRIVLDIGANLNSLSDRIINSFLCKFV